MVRCWWPSVWLVTVAGILAEPHWFTQRVDHFSTSEATFQQRFYEEAAHFGGPGSPIFVIMGGEGGIPPSVGLFYPFIVDVLAKHYGALVIEPEHRFYGESLPFGTQSFALETLHLMTSSQALADAAMLIRAQQRIRNCTGRGTPGYCPVLTVGGSYPGFLSAMMRVRYPAVVDMAYAASAPMKFYTQEVGQYEYYAKVSESAERVQPGCSDAVFKAFQAMEAFVANASVKAIVDRFALCPHLPADRAINAHALADDLVFLAEQTFANLNMANYPPGTTTGLWNQCWSFISARANLGTEGLLDAMRAMLLTETQAATVGRQSGRAIVGSGTEFAGGLASIPGGECFNVTSALPAGRNATARCGDWSGCGAGRDGEMWDYQTCTLEVERIGFGPAQKMFPPRPWTAGWLSEHCSRRFGVSPQPLALTDLWGFDTESLRAQASRIVFTNGLQDGWSVGGILEDLAPEKGLLAINMPNGAHHSDLSHALPSEDTHDVQDAHARITALIGEWLGQVASPGRDVSNAADGAGGGSGVGGHTTKAQIVV